MKKSCQGEKSVDARVPSAEDVPRFVLDHLLSFLPGPYAMLSAYIDESGTDRDSPAMCVAGLLYTEESLKPLDEEWKVELERVGVSYFHAVDEAHLVGEFKGKTRESIAHLYPRLIEIVNSRACGAFGVYTIPEEEFDKFVPREWEYSQYTTCAYICMAMLVETAREQGYEQVSFAIESGHENMGQLNTLIAELRGAGWPGVGPCQFNNKKDLRLLQTADLWAYELVKHARDRLLTPERPLRKSLEALIRDDLQKRVLVLNKETLRVFFDRYFGLMSDEG